MAFGSVPHPHSLCLRLLLSVSTIITISSFDFLLRSAPFLAANFGRVEQLAARKAHNLEVTGSSPVSATKGLTFSINSLFFQTEVPRQAPGYFCYMR